MMTAFVTGASKGIGFSVTNRLLQQGVAVTTYSRTAGELAHLADNPLLTIRLGSVLDFAAQRAALPPEVDIVVACAGVCAQADFGEEQSADIWRRVMDINVEAVFELMRLASRALRPGGSFVAISSGLGKNARPGYGAYCASKHALLGMVRCAALEWAPRAVRANAVCPGWVDTEMAAADMLETSERLGIPLEETRARVARAIPLGRAVKPDEVAQTVVWLASKSAAMITGQAIAISGGEFLW